MDVAFENRLYNKFFYFGRIGHYSNIRSFTVSAIGWQTLMLHDISKFGC